jgi:hypothetical protein
VAEEQIDSLNDRHGASVVAVRRVLRDYATAKRDAWRLTDHVVNTWARLAGVTPSARLSRNAPLSTTPSPTAQHDAASKHTQRLTSRRSSEWPACEPTRYSCAKSPVPASPAQRLSV